MYSRRDTSSYRRSFGLTTVEKTNERWLCSSRGERVGERGGGGNIQGGSFSWGGQRDIARHESYRNATEVCLSLAVGCVGIYNLTDPLGTCLDAVSFNEAT